uniref:Ig-like domain-containing protein n=1 Tax=Monopterus albus TaxID=43700 RepID=A0A3Q3QLI9_MONAL
MPLLDELGRLSGVFLAVLLRFTFQGAHCELVVSPAGPTQVNAIVGSNLTLAVSFSGAPDPVVIWLMGDLPVVTWTIGSSVPPDIPENMRKVLKVEQNGSLTFVNVSLGFASNYTVKMTKSGVGNAVLSFTLKVFENIQNVTLSTQPDFAKEGTDLFILQYSMLQGVVEHQMWFFNDIPIKTNSHYLMEPRSLVILRPNRSDAGQYTVLLTNPFSSVTTHINVTVLYGPDEPVLEAHPAQPFYVAEDSLSLSCHAEGFPQPTVQWDFGGQMLSDTHKGVLNLTNVRTSQGGIYTCTVLNEKTKEKRQKSTNLNVYGSPAQFLSAVRTTHDSEGKIVVTIYCVSDASPKAVVSWSRDSGAITSGTAYQISSDTTQLMMVDYNVSNFLLQNYTCTCRNPLGSQSREIQLQGPSVSNSILFPNQDGTVVTLTWEIPPTSIVTGFDIQMKGPDLLSTNHTGIQTRGSSDGYRTIQQKPGSARSTDIFGLEPKLTYQFRVIPRANMTEGVPSVVHIVGPGMENCSTECV